MKFIVILAILTMPFIAISQEEPAPSTKEEAQQKKLMSKQVEIIKTIKSQLAKLLK